MTYETGLQPVLLADPCAMFWRPADMAALDQTDAGVISAPMWRLWWD
jgi:hypothetical protein